MLMLKLFLETAAERREMSSQAAGGQSGTTMTKVTVLEIVRPQGLLQRTP